MNSCVDCVGVRRLALELNVRPAYLHALLSNGQIEAHHHGVRMTVAKTAADDLRWRVAVARAEWAA